MNLTPREKDKLLVSVAAMVAERRLKRGVKLNYPEAVALITDYVLEGARDGRSVAELMRDGGTVVTREQVMDGVAEMIHEIQVEGDLPGRDQAGDRARAHPVKASSALPLHQLPTPRRRGPRGDRFCRLPCPRLRFRGNDGEGGFW